METNVNFWNGLTIDEKRCFIDKYQILKQGNFVDKLLAELLENKFGKDVLEEKQIKTWDNVEKKGLVHADTGATYLLDIDKNHYSKELALKALATLQIAKLIELSYGGMVSEEEWVDDSEEKYVITCSYKGEIGFEYSLYDRFFIAFHTPEQREEFMSHESNRKLVEQYYMM